MNDKSPLRKESQEMKSMTEKNRVDLSICVALDFCGPGHGYRIRNWRTCVVELDALAERLGNTEIVVVEFGDTAFGAGFDGWNEGIAQAQRGARYSPEQDLELRHLKRVRGKGFFSRSRGRNQAWRAALADRLCFVDADFIMRPDAWERAIGESKEFDACSPYSRFQKLGQKKTSNRINGDGSFRWHVPIDNLGGGSVPFKNANLAGGMMICTRGFMEAVGGWDERFQSWGYEDRAVFRTADLQGAKIGMIENEAIHLYHKPDKKNHCQAEQVYKKHYETAVSETASTLAVKPISARIKQKMWGTSEEIYQGASDEIHRISVLPGGSCSIHRHARKSNRFVIESGSLTVETFDCPDELSKTKTSHNLIAGESVTIPAGVIHRFKSKDGASAFEIYHGDCRPDDIERLDNSQEPAARPVAYLIANNPVARCSEVPRPCDIVVRMNTVNPFTRSLFGGRCDILFLNWFGSKMRPFADWNHMLSNQGPELRFIAPVEKVQAHPELQDASCGFIAAKKLALEGWDVRLVGFSHVGAKCHQWERERELILDHASHARASMLLDPLASLDQDPVFSGAS